MVQLDLLSAPAPGRSWVAGRFPVRAGRASDNDFQLTAPGVFDRHFELTLTADHAIELAVVPPALVSVNARAVTRCPLRNGDMVEAGAARLRFWLSPTRQAGLRSGEWSVWLAWFAVAAAQAALLRWLNS